MALTKILHRSIARHRRHLVSACPAPPCDHFAPAMKLVILKIHRVLNPELLNLYLAKRQHLQFRRGACPPLPVDFASRAIPLQTEDCSGSNVNEVLLFHGSNRLALGNIMEEGFDPRRAGEATAKAFGLATYFTPNASKADYYIRKKKGKRFGDCLYMIAARVCLGRAAVLKDKIPTAVRPPNNQDGSSADSVVALSRQAGGCVDHPEAMIYNEGLALPEYLISYRHAEDCACHRCKVEEAEAA
eukprot:TRINITY_DN28562_c0_g1_i1.p1 TRINITY_DN28562_c0_g1~~TRINITY_DN28562_c0_g1_i1.p1  ORF type:complete len:244 (+),score=28.44 TRINITY_DN28562_c0_g1_i1:165-896(+)